MDSPLILILVIIAYLGYVAWGIQTARDAKVPYQARVKDPERAHARAAAALKQAGLQLGTGDWEEDEDGTRRGFFRVRGGAFRRALNSDFGIRVLVRTNGEVRAVLANDGAYSRQVLFGFIPFGPKEPVGGDAFRKAKRHLKEMFG